MKDDMIWGLDLGGTKIECAVLARSSFEVLARERIATERDLGYKHIVHQVQTLIRRVSAQLNTQPKALGIGMPGVPDPLTGILKNGNTLCLNGQPFKADLEALLGARVLIANDANCFALAESRIGSVPRHYPDAEVVFGVVLGTGAGGGIVVNGKVLRGHHGIAGEWGHIYLDDSGGQCYCGNIGCVEQVISGTALERYYAALSGESKSLKDIQASVASDIHAKQTIDRLVSMFARAITQVINVLDPDAIVVGGGVSHIDALFEESIPLIEQYIYNDSFNAKLLRPELGDSAGVFGAAMLLL